MLLSLQPLNTTNFPSLSLPSPQLPHAVIALKEKPKICYPIGGLQIRGRRIYEKM